MLLKILEFPDLNIKQLLHVFTVSVTVVVEHLNGILLQKRKIWNKIKFLGCRWGLLNNEKSGYSVIVLFLHFFIVNFTTLKTNQVNGQLPG